MQMSCKIVNVAILEEVIDHHQQEQLKIYTINTVLKLNSSKLRNGLALHLLC